MLENDTCSCVCDAYVTGTLCGMYIVMALAWLTFWLKYSQQLKKEEELYYVIKQYNITPTS